MTSPTTALTLHRCCRNSIYVSKQLVLSVFTVARLQVSTPFQKAVAGCPQLLHGFCLHHPWLILARGLYTNKEPYGQFLANLIKVAHSQNN